MAKGYVLHGQVLFPAGKEVLLQSAQTTSGSKPGSYPMGIRGSVPGVKGTGLETGHSSPPNAEFHSARVFMAWWSN